MTSRFLPLCLALTCGLASCDTTDPSKLSNTDSVGGSGAGDGDAGPKGATGGAGSGGTTGGDAGAGSTSQAGSQNQAGASSVGTEQLIGPQGGVLVSTDGKATLTVPPKALGATLSITERASKLPSDGLGSDAYDFGPDGQLFQRDVELCIQPKADANTKTACLGYYDEKGGSWVCEDRCLTQKGGTLCGSTDHFTNFAILLTGGAGESDSCSDMVIGPEGGTIKTPDGSTVVTVPKNAVSKKLRFSVNGLSDSPPEVTSPVVDLEPGGTFLQDIEVCLTPNVDAKSETPCLGYFDEKNDKWLCEDTCLEKRDDKYCGSTHHFTNFALLLGGGTKSSDACDDKYFTEVGGWLTSPDGGATLTVPKDVIKTGQRLTVSEPSITGAELISKAYSFTPNGNFDAPLSLCIDAKEGAATDNSCLGYQDEDTGKWVCEDTCISRKGNTVCGTTDHFTNFAVLLSGGTCK